MAQTILVFLAVATAYGAPLDFGGLSGGGDDGLNSGVYNAGRVAGAYNPLTLITGAAINTAGGGLPAVPGGPAVSQQRVARSACSECDTQNWSDLSESDDGQSTVIREARDAPSNPLGLVAGQALSLVSSAGNGGLAGIADGWGVSHSSKTAGNTGASKSANVGLGSGGNPLAGGASSSGSQNSYDSGNGAQFSQGSQGGSNSFSSFQKSSSSFGGSSGGYGHPGPVGSDFAGNSKNGRYETYQYQQSTTGGQGTGFGSGTAQTTGSNNGNSNYVYTRKESSYVSNGSGNTGSGSSGSSYNGQTSQNGFGGNGQSGLQKNQASFESSSSQSSSGNQGRYGSSGNQGSFGSSSNQGSYGASGNQGSFGSSSYQSSSSGQSNGQGSGYSGGKSAGFTPGSAGASNAGSGSSSGGAKGSAGGLTDGLNPTVYNAARIAGAYNPLTLITGTALSAAGGSAGPVTRIVRSPGLFDAQSSGGPPALGQSTSFSGSPSNPLSQVAAQALSLTSSAGNGGLAGIADGWGVQH